MSAGLYYNFGELEFIKTTSTPEVNKGGYTDITNNDPKVGTVVGTGAGLFLTNKAEEVRLLTLKEVNAARGLSSDPDNRTAITEAQDPKGIFRLDQLTNVKGIGKVEYTYTEDYRIASPVPSNYDSDQDAVSYIDGWGRFNSNKGTQPEKDPVRPVVKISR